MKDDELILKEFDTADITEGYIATWMAQRGFKVYRKPKMVRPSYEEREGYGDDGDLMVQMKVEVKWKKGASFTDKHWPFKEQSVLLDNVGRIDKMPENELMAYIILNKDMTWICFVPGKTRKHWFKGRRDVGPSNLTADYYHCPLEHVSFFPFDVESVGGKALAVDAE